MAKRREARSAEVVITGYTKDGFGLGSAPRADGAHDSVEVPYTMPGDTAQALLLRKRHGHYQARLEAIIAPAAERIDPRCVHFATCGGCRWQHLPYSLQLQNKKSAVQRAFESLVTTDTQSFPIIGCDVPWYYRNKMEFSFSSNLAGEHFLGLMMASGRQRVVQLKECHLVTSWYMDALDATREWWGASGLESYHGNRDTGSLRTLTVREGKYTGDRMVVLTVSGNPDYALSKENLTAWVDAMTTRVSPTQPEATLSLFLRIQQIAKGTPTRFYEMHLSGRDHIREQLRLFNGAEVLECKISLSAFFQPSTLQAEKLYTRALEMAELRSDMIVYDLFCGTGTMGLAAARRVRQVVGIELSHESVLDARHNAAVNGITNATFYPGDVAVVLSDLLQHNKIDKPDLVIVDPPRAGLGEKAIVHLLALASDKIVYVSCNPISQAADCALLAAGGYEVVALQPVDQFAQTVHIENIALLKRKR